MSILECMGAMSILECMGAMSILECMGAMSILEYYVRDAAHANEIEEAKAESLLLLRTSGASLACRNMVARMHQIGVNYRYMDLLAYACSKDEKMAREFVEGF